METLAFSHLACSAEESDNKEYTVCVDFKKLSTAGAMGLLSAATLAGAMTINTESAAAYGYGSYGSYGGYGGYGRYGGSRSYGKSSGHYYKKVVSSSYKRSYGRSSGYGSYGRYGRYGGYGGYGGGYGGCGGGCGCY